MRHLPGSQAVGLHPFDPRFAGSFRPPNTGQVWEAMVRPGMLTHSGWHDFLRQHRFMLALPMAGDSPTLCPCTQQGTEKKALRNVFSHTSALADTRQSETRTRQQRSPRRGWDAVAQKKRQHLGRASLSSKPATPCVHPPRRGYERQGINANGAEHAGA